MKRILVIDDQDYILESTSLLLRFEGYDVLNASNGKMGVEAALRHVPDLILCDISMPEMDGFGVLEQVRANKATAAVPFIFLTARAEKDDMRKGMARGADDYLIKPYTRDELIAAVEAQWKKHALIGEKVEEVGRTIAYALPHEFRIVLNEVMGSAVYLRSIAQNVTPEGINDITSDILKSAHRLMRITDNFLSYIRIETYFSDPVSRNAVKKFRLEEPAASLYDLCMAKASMFARSEDLEFGVIAEGFSVAISSESFAKVIDEIVDNAFRFSVPGEKVHVDTILDIDQKQFTVKIADNGRGMAPEQIHRIGAFKQFDRMIYEQQGVGLGLIIAKRTIELHDGTFIIQSAEGQGTAMQFTLPAIIP